MNLRFQIGAEVFVFLIKAVVSDGFIKNCISAASKKVQEKGAAVLFNATAPSSSNSNSQIG